MKLSISDIAWPADMDDEIYSLMEEFGFSGLEIAPTRIFPEKPYEKLNEATEWTGRLKANYGLSISSMQSIWYGRVENIFGSEREKEILLDYTKKAIDFAAAIGCRNLVFGCPRNRNLPEGADADSAVPFFKAVGDYAYRNGTVIGMEANPPMYHTNYINTTESAFTLVKMVGSEGFRLNLDTGTMIENKESVDILRGNVSLISHVHISEPGLFPVQKRELHDDLKKVLQEEGYGNYISIEMNKADDVSAIVSAMEYVRGIFG